MLDLHSLKLEGFQHRKNLLWFNSDGTDVLYGPDVHNLVYPDGLEITGRLFHFYLRDIVNAFKLGLSIGKGEEE